MKDIDSRLPIISEACANRKGFDLKILDLRGLTAMTDYFVIVSGNSRPQVLGISEEIEEKMKKSGHKLFGREGQNTSNWLLLDYGDIVVHIFQKDERDFYNLDKLWADGKELTI